MQWLQYEQCMNLGKNNFRVARDFFSYRMGPPTSISLLTQLRRLKRRHVHINFIRVGSDQFSANDRREIDQALNFTRGNYAQVFLGIGRTTSSQPRMPTAPRTSTMTTRPGKVVIPRETPACVARYALASRVRISALGFTKIQQKAAVR